MNLLVNFKVAKYVLENYSGFSFRSVCDMNCGIRRAYRSAKSMDTIPEDSFYRTHLVWLPIVKPTEVDISQNWLAYQTQVKKV